MKFEKHLTRFNEPFWFCGIYKITMYTWFNGVKCKPRYHAYFIPPGLKNWGDYVGGKPAQHDKKLTFKQAVKLCEKHAKTYAPSAKQIKQAEIAKAAWLKH